MSDDRPVAVIHLMLAGNDIIASLGWPDVEVYVAIDHHNETVVTTGPTYAEAVLGAEARGYRTEGRHQAFPDGGLVWEHLGRDGDGDGDQSADLPGTRFWAEIGKASGGRWSWTIVGRDDQGFSGECDGGYVDTEAEAKATVADWRNRCTEVPS